MSLSTIDEMIELHQTTPFERVDPYPTLFRFCNFLLSGGSAPLIVGYPGLDATGRRDLNVNSSGIIASTWLVEASVAF